MSAARCTPKPTPIPGPRRAHAPGRDPGAADPGSSRADGSAPKDSEPGTSDPGASGLGLTAPDASAGTGPSHVPGIPGLPDIGGPVPHAPPAAVPVRPTAGPGG